MRVERGREERELEGKYFKIDELLIRLATSGL
jgi:hypothetical protein